MFVDVSVIDGQAVSMTCNYSTPYPIPESDGYYLYDGIDLTINTNFVPTSAVNLQNAQITRIPMHLSTTLFRGIFDLGTPACLSVWENRCAHTFDQDGSCDPCGYSITLSGYDTSTDDIEYLSTIATSGGTESCNIALTGVTSTQSSCEVTVNNWVVVV